MNNKLYLMTAILAFASVGALLIQPTLASAQTKSNSILDPTSGGSTSTPTKKSSTAAATDLPAKSLSCGEVIKESVKLSANLDCKSDGLIVGADGITIDLNGHAISGPGPKSSKIGIMLATSSGVTIKGLGIISGFQAGILNTGGQDNNIDNILYWQSNCNIQYWCKKYRY